MTERLKNPVPQFFDDAGDPLINGKLYFFETGTATPKNTYADIGLTIPNSNPVILDASGRAPNIFLNGVYKTKLTTSDETQEWERDSVGEVSDVQFSGWDATKTYGVSDIVQGSNLVYYRSLVSGNISNDPATTPAAWEEILVVGEDTAGRGSDYVPWVGQSKSVTAALDDHETRIGDNETGISANAQNITDQGDGTDAMPSPDITSFGNSLHNHSDGAGGGPLGPGLAGLASVQVFTASYPITAPTLAIGTTKTDIANAAFDYLIDGISYSKGAVAAGTPPGTDLIPQNTYGAVALDIDAAGAITVVEATDNTTGYASAALAIAGIADPAVGDIRMGTVSVIRSDAAFEFGTDDLDVANSTVVYTDAPVFTLTWVKPSAISSVVVEVVGGGGHGGGGAALSGGGGGGGGGASTVLVDVSAISSEIVTVGAEGATSSFGAHASATGGASGTTGTTTGDGGDGGVGSGGDINLGGADGDGGSTLHGGSGGVAAGWNGGGGGGGKDGNGSDGNKYGGGGAGGGPSGVVAASGSGGVVVVWEYK